MPMSGFPEEVGSIVRARGEGSDRVGRPLLQSALPPYYYHLQRGMGGSGRSYICASKDHSLDAYWGCEVYDRQLHSYFYSFSPRILVAMGFGSTGVLSLLFSS
jgi:hypothetical protein